MLAALVVLLINLDILFVVEEFLIPLKKTKINMMMKLRFFGQLEPVFSLEKKSTEN